jgi:hypothetical protein
MSFFSGQDDETPVGTGSFVALSQKKEAPILDPAPSTPEEQTPVESHGAFGAPSAQTIPQEVAPPVVPVPTIKPETPKLFGQGVLAEAQPEPSSPVIQQPSNLPKQEEPITPATLLKPEEKAFEDMTEEEKLANITEREAKIRKLLANAERDMGASGLPNSFLLGVVVAAKSSFTKLKDDVEKTGRGRTPQFTIALNKVLSGLPAEIAAADERFKKIISEKNKSTTTTPPSSIGNTPSINKNVGGGDIKPKMPTVKKETVSPETAPSVVVYGRPGTSPRITPAPQEPIVAETPVVPIVPPQESVAEIPVVPETKPLPPTPQEAPVAPILEASESAAPQVGRLFTILKNSIDKTVTGTGSLSKGVAVAVLLSSSPVAETGIPKPQPKPQVQAPTQKTQAPQTSLSPEERSLFSLFATKDITDVVASFGIDTVSYNATCEKMKATGVTPYKMLNDGSFVTFEIATANGNRDVRKEISSIIVSVGSFASKLGVENPIVTEYSNESLEQYLARLQDVVKKSVSRTS